MRCPPDFDLDWMIGFLRARAVPGLEHVTDTAVERALTTPKGPAVVRSVFRVGTDGSVSVRSSGLSASASRALVRRWFDLDTDLAPFHRLARRDRILGPLVRQRPGLRRPLIVDPFEGVVRAVVGQQVSVAAARTMVGRLVSRFGAPAGNSSGIELFTFPEPDRIAALPVADLRGLGFTTAKSKALIRLAKATVSGELDWNDLATRGADEAQEVLESLPGIGPWTAAYLRLRVLGDPDAFPATDLGLIKGLGRFGIEARQIEAAAERWRPWRGYATIHLWSSLSER